MLTDDERKTLTEAAKLLALDGMLDAAAGAHLVDATAYRPEVP